jgi:hypothetical protein
MEVDISNERIMSIPSVVDVFQLLVVCGLAKATTRRMNAIARKAKGRCRKYIRKLEGAFSNPAEEDKRRLAFIERCFQIYHPIIGISRSSNRKYNGFAKNMFF